MDKKKIKEKAGKYLLLGFCSVSVVFNVLNYLKMNQLDSLGSPYAWEQNFENKRTKEQLTETDNIPEETAASGKAAAASEKKSSVTEKKNPSAEKDVSAIEQETAIQQNESTEAGSRININTAGTEELLTLPGIGETKAKAIEEYRNVYGSFTCIEELMEVKGIGEGIFSKIKDHVTVE